MESILRTKSEDFAVSIILFCRKLRDKHVEFPLINQLIKSGTSIGANIHEAQYAQSTKDFISKLEISLKECIETDYWFNLLFKTGSISEMDYCLFLKNLNEIRRMLISSIVKLKKKIEQNSS